MIKQHSKQKVLQGEYIRVISIVIERHKLCVYTKKGSL